ncbi:MAG: hypothetical protein ABIL09_11430 [Gemmatimonadota bacterium]
MIPLKRALQLARRSWWAAAVLAAAFGSPATADDPPAGPTVTDEAAIPPLLYVIKVTPTLVYLDAGAEGGAAYGQEYLLLREDPQRRGYAKVGAARAIRLFEGFCIAEITALEPGEEVAVLQRAILRETWDRMAAAAAAGGREMVLAPAAPEARRAPVAGTRSIHVLGGLELGKAIHLREAAGVLVGADEMTDAGIAVRLGKTFARRWRLGLTYRVAGQPLQMADADVTQLAIEADVQLLLRGLGQATPYLGVGGGMHQLSWDAPSGGAGQARGDLNETTYKVGLNIMAGFEVPTGDGWCLLVEGGYQKLKAWDQSIDGSNVRLYAGLGRLF